MSPSSISHHDLSLASGTTVHYLEAGSPDLPKILILHGYPTSSNQYRDLISLLGRTGKYHVLAPDLPGFGLTTVPNDHEHSFENIAKVIGEWLDRLSVTRVVVYTNDYGSPTAIRLALDRPDLFRGIVSQSGNAYVEGLVPTFWDPLRGYWASKPGSKEYDDFRKKIAAQVLTLEATQWQYTHGVPSTRSDLIDPLLAWTDYTQNIKPKEQQELQLDLFYDYQTNLDLYPAFQAYLRESTVRVFAIWGKNDEIFGPAGAEAYARDSKDAQVRLLDGGHFLALSHLEEVGAQMEVFLDSLEG